MYKSDPSIVLKKVNICFSELNIPFWLHGGVLLGAVRENNFLPHDTDIDIGILFKNKSENMHNCLLKHGFKKKQTLYNIEQNIIEDTYIFNDIGVDIFCYFENETKMWTYAFSCIEKGTSWNGNINILKYTWEKFNLEKINFAGGDYNIPSPPEKWLTEAFGDWKNPKQNWSYDSHTLNKELTRFYGKLTYR